MIDAVLDTNVLASGIAGEALPASSPGELFRRSLVNRFELVLSEHILAELERALAKPYFRARLTSTQVDRARVTRHSRANRPRHRPGRRRRHPPQRRSGPRDRRFGQRRVPGHWPPRSPSRGPLPRRHHPQPQGFPHTARSAPPEYALRTPLRRNIDPPLATGPDAPGLTSSPAFAPGTPSPAPPPWSSDPWRRGPRPRHAGPEPPPPPSALPRLHRLGSND